MKTTKAMRDRLRELSHKDGTDDYDRVVVMVVDDLEEILASRMGWQPIETAPKDVPTLVAAYIVPSQEAQRNGSKAFWDIAIGWAYGTKLDRWSGILGGQPTHWMPAPAPPQTDEPLNGR